MGFPEDALAPHEKLVLNLHPHPWVLAQPVALLVVALGAGIAAVAFKAPDPLKLLCALVVIAAAFWFLSRFVVWYATFFVLSSDRVIYRSGIIRRHSREIPLDKVNTVSTSQNIFERMLRIGDIEIESASTDGAQVFEDIRRPDDVRKEIYVQMESNENRKFDRMGEVAHAGGGGSDVAGQIAQLADLRDRNAITEAEYQSKKNELLGRM
jgi:uncharacterized membrane protein YdbT with pleckstrin-like domain